MEGHPATFHTATMAKILADQNKLEDAAQVYRRVLKSDPDNAQVREALQTVEDKLFQFSSERFHRLANKWVDLLLYYRHFKRLKIMGQRIDRQR
jgi:hypothetical protein